MAEVLYVEASPRKQRSASTEVAQAFLEAYRQAHPADSVQTIDVWRLDIPEFDGAAFEAKYAGIEGRERSAEPWRWQGAADMSSPRESNKQCAATTSPRSSSEAPPDPLFSHHGERHDMNPLTFTRVALLAGGLAIAAAPTFAGDTLKIARSYELSTAPAKTWGAIKDFGGVHTWIPAIEKTDISKGGHNKVGTVRVLGLKGGGGVTEELTAYSGAGHSMSYRMLESPLPVVGYRSTLTVKPGKSGGSIVSWSANFKAKEGTPDAEAKKVIEGIYDSSVDNLKQQLGG